MTLEKYLSDAGMKPSSFAAELGVPASTITRLLKGERSPRLDLIGRIQTATAGKVTANDFLAPAPTPERAAS
jgi:predicted transcriptional regulator